MDMTLAAFLLAAFLAVVLVIEGGYLIWDNSKGPEVKRLERRLRALSAGGQSDVKRLLKRSQDDLPFLDRMLLQLPRVQGLDRIIEQSGSPMSVTRLLVFSLLIGFGTLIVLSILSVPVWAQFAIAVVASMLPIMFIMFRRRTRLEKIEKQMPEAVDLIARALRSGHAFQSGLQMVGDELNEPIADEFAILADEINFGIPIHDAFMNLSARVPLDDVRFFSIAVLLQRETGGNLAEILDNIAALIRARFRLLGKIRVLSAEGRLSAWILTLLPIGTALLINLINPGFMSVLWTDPAGLNLVYLCLTLALAGIVWMWRIIKIRV